MFEPAGAAAHESPPILRTTTPAGLWVGSITPELVFGNSSLPDWAVNSRLLNSVVPKVSYGLTDRIELGIYPLGVAYRWGDANGTEIVPAFSLNPFISHSPTAGVVVAVNPFLSLDARQWTMPGNNITLGVMLSPGIAYSEGCDPFGPTCNGSFEGFQDWFLAGQGGIGQTFGSVTVTIGAAIQYTFDIGQAAQDTAAFTIGSRLRHGLRTDPTLRWHINRQVSLDGHIEYTRNITRGSGVAVASVGVNVVW